MGDLTLALVVLVVVATAVVVALDASVVGARRGLVPGLCDLDPLRWFLVVLLAWPVGVVAWMAVRERVRAAAAARRQR